MTVITTKLLFSMVAMTENKGVPTLRFQGFDEDWELKKFGEIGSTNGGLTYSPSNVVEDGGTLVLRSSNIQNGQISFDDNVYVDCKIGEKEYVKENDILLCSRNGSKRLIGKSILIKKEEEGFAFGAFMAIYRSEFNPFISQFIDSSRFYKQVHEHLGATINQITGKSLNSFKLHIPTLPEQQKIATFLSSVDAKLQQLSKKKSLLADYKKGVMQKIFSQEIRFCFGTSASLSAQKNSTSLSVQNSIVEDNHAVVSTPLNHQNLVAEQNTVAERSRSYPDWEEKKLGEVCDVIVGGTPSTTKKEYWNGNIGWISSGGLNNGNVTQPSKLITKLGLNSSSAKMMPENTVMLAMTGATLGKIGYLKFRSSGNQSVAGFLPNDTYNSKYLFYTLQEGINQVFRYAGGAAQQGINKQSILNLKYKFPIKAEQQQIANFLSALDTKIEKVNTQINNTQAFKKGLLQQMFV